ncbi:hypothetical protein UlMin_033440 [Ulmus minor]
MDLVAASSSSSPSPSPSSVPTWKYDVFISFRGEDTRKTFTSHLHDALRREKIETYIDEENLARGAEISPALLKAIEESMVSVIIFSENYANSSWCLDELVHILKCRLKYGQQVVPIFYKVDPSHVRKQQGSYATAFKKLQKGYKEKVNSWRAALTEAANLAGWSPHQTRNESKLVDETVKDILKKLSGMSPSYDHAYFLKDLFGIEKHIKKIESFLDIGTQCVRILGIWGMGGVGKTTLADVLFKKFAPLFEGCCFLPNVREESEKGNGLRDLKVKLFSKLLNQKVIDLDRTFGMSRLIRRKKVFIVLDDVSSVEQLKVLAGDRDWFGLESRIIITTRDKRALIHQVDVVHKLDGLNHHEALQLFHSNAFRKGYPTTEFEELSQQVLNYAGGNPLALKIFGSFLSGRKIETWESALKRLKSSTLEDSSIQKILKISYDGLRKDEKDTFLDIACLFKGKDKNFVERMLDDDSSPGTIIDDLVDKSLITIERNKIIQMHDLVQEIGREIVRQQSIKEPGKRSRIWDAKDAYHVLKNNTGTIEVEAIFLNTYEIRETYLRLPQGVFEKMYNLRLLKISHSNSSRKCKVYLPPGLESLPEKLKYLKWMDYPLKSFPGNFNPCNLVVLEMPNSEVEQLWDGVQDLQNLRKLNLRKSKKLTQLPDLSLALNIEHVDLSWCKHLLEVPPYFQHLDKLTTLLLSGCPSLNKFPELPKNVKKICLSGPNIEIEQLCSSSIDHLSSLVHLELSDLKMLESFPNILHMKSVRHLTLRRCLKLKIFPEISEPHECLLYLWLSATAIKEIPWSIENLLNLNTLTLTVCKELEFLPKSICKLHHLKVLTISNCSKLKSLPELPSSIQCIEASGCMSLEEISSSTSSKKQGWDYTARFCCCIFGNCWKLDMNARINVMAYAQSIIFQRNISKGFYLDMGIYWAGHETPIWFSHHSENSSISIELSSDCFGTDFLCIAFCAIAHFNDDSALFNKLIICCQAQCVGPHGELLSSSWDAEYHGTRGLHGDHVFITCDKLRLRKFMQKQKEKKGTTITILFNFSIKVLDDHGSYVDLEVKKCGVHLLYAEDDAAKLGRKCDNIVEQSENIQSLYLEELEPIDSEPDHSNDSRR